MTAQRLTPIFGVFRQGIVACIAFMVPVFVVLYAMATTHGSWHFVLFWQLVFSAAVLFSTWRFFQLAILVSPDSISERGFFRIHRSYSREEIGSIVLARAYSGLEIHPQLFVLSPSGTLLIRMRGQFWTRESMDQVAETLDVPVRTIDEPISVAELRDTMPAMLYWFERHPVVAGFVFATSLSAIGAGILLALRLTRVLS